MRISRSGTQACCGWARVSRRLLIGALAAVLSACGGPGRACRVYFAPVPVPVGVFSDEVRGYVLVSYDESSEVSAYDSGITHRENLSWRTPMEGEDSILLMAGDDRFAVETRHHTPSVFISAARRDEYQGTERPRVPCAEASMCRRRCPKRFANGRC